MTSGSDPDVMSQMSPLLEDRLPAAVDVAVAVDVQDRAHAAAVAVPDGEAAVLGRAVDLLLVPLGRTTDVLERGPVGEVGEEVGHRTVLLVRTQHVARGRLALALGVVLVLDANVAAVVQRRGVLAHVSGRVDAVGARAKPRVAAHAAAVAELEA